MGEVAVGVLGGSVGVLVAALILAGWTVRDAFNARVASDVALVAGERARAQVERARDDALASTVRLTIERDEARALAATVASSLAVARGELTKYVRERLASGSDADVAAELDRLLGGPVPTVRPGAPPAGGDHGAPGPGPVSGT